MAASWSGRARSYWHYVKLVAAYLRARGMIAAFFALLAFIATVLVVVTEPRKPGSWYSLFTVLSAIFAALTVIRLSMKANFDDNYSLAYALAHGYVSNFARTAIEDLKRQQPRGGTFVIFRPEGLEELDDAAVATFKQRISALGYTATVRHLDSEGKRVRDVLVLEGRTDGGGTLRYIDFPSTLLTLNSLVDYRSGERKRKSNAPYSQAERQILTQELIDKFFEELVKLLALDVAEGRVEFTDSRMIHL